MSVLCHIRLLTVAAFLVLVSATSFASPSKGLIAGLEAKVVEYRLPNGMKWLIYKHGSAPVFSGIVQVKVGSVDEEKGKTGLAHMLEHMAFKGTKDIPPEGLWDAFITNGATNLNAYTSKDETAYYASMPSAKLELWMYLTSEMLKNTSLKDFEKEREVVLEELVGKIENNPFRKMDAALLGTAFRSSPYMWPTIGIKEDVAGLTAADLIEFKKKYYVPERMIGAVVGNVDVERTKELLVRYFGNIPGRAPARQDLPVEPSQTAMREAKVKFDASPQLMMAFHKPTVPSRDDYIFDLITYVLCGGDNSRLRRTLIFEKKLVRTMGCDSSHPGVRLDNLFVIEAEPIAGKSYAEVKDAVWDVINELAEKGLDEAGLLTAKNNVLKDFVFGLDKNEDVANALSYFELVTGSWKYMVRQPEVIEGITSKEIVATMKRYMTKENMTVVELVK